MQLPRWLTPLVGILALLVLAQGELVELAVDWLWFQALDHEQVFITSTVARIGLWLVGLLSAATIVGLNVRWAVRQRPLNYVRLSMMLSELGMTAAQLKRLVNLALAAAVILPSLLFASILSAQWMEVLAFVHRVDFGSADPIFGHDVGFYFFALPVLELARGWIVGLLTVTLLPVAGVYFAREAILSQGQPQLEAGPRAHLLSLLSLLFVGMALGYVLDRYDLLFASRGVVHGVGYADATVQIPALWVMVVTTLGVAGALVVSIFREGWRTPMTAGAVWLAASVVVNGMIPGAVQTYLVKPNELELEREYLTHNIRATREAFALDRIEVRPFEAASGLTMDDLQANPLTVNNVRLWDTRPLLTTYSQLQEIRLYYDFVDVDVDRYMVDGELRQVMLSAREFNYDNVPETARGWVNQHLQYTHGYGLTMSPVNVVTQEGLPELWVKDIPPESTIDLPIDQPGIYYGELTDPYVIVKTSAQEFDYPTGDENTYTDYAGDGGIDIGSVALQTLFSLYLGEFDVLLSQYIQPESRILLHRNIADRVYRIAPFLGYDRDPYLVVADGKLYWMLDAYTTSSRYPYSEPYNIRRGRAINYMRNSVKVVVDAYNGDVSFYVADESDPLVTVYENIFPGTFQDLEQMPESLRSHIRYPSDFFDIQADMYRAYHMTDETVFYNKEDMWEMPLELYGGQQQEMESYYLIMKLPEAEEAEFILLVPFTPPNKDNMISWLAARSDDESYGKLVLYQFPKQKLIYGPRQIEARIDQDPEISEQITLWSQAGSRVVRGNLLVIPIGDSLMYVEPLYLQAETGQLPELKRVIVSYENRLAMRKTLGEALRAVFGEGTTPAVIVRDPETGEVLDQTEAEAAAADAARGPALGINAGWALLVDQANADYDRAVRAQKAGDWAAYGEALTELESTLRDLRALSTEDQAPEAVEGLEGLGGEALPDGEDAPVEDAPPEAPSPE